MISKKSLGKYRICLNRFISANGHLQAYKKISMTMLEVISDLQGTEYFIDFSQSGTSFILNNSDRCVFVIKYFMTIVW